MKRRVVFHPFFFALAPILSVYVHNIDQVPFRLILPSIGFVLISTLILFLVLAWIVRSFEKSGLVVSAFVLVFLAYGHFATGYPPYIIVLAGPGALALVTLLVLRTRRDLRLLTQTANLVSAILIAFNILLGMARSLMADDVTIRLDLPEQKAASYSADDTRVGELPDIYFIVLDGYARTDVLQELYGYDNRPFLDQLRQRGFRIAEESRSNYSQTLLSLGSTLNMVYLDSVAAQAGYDNVDRKPLMGLVKNSHVLGIVTQYGYETFAFASGYSGAEIKNADHFVSRGFPLSEFEHTLIQNSALSINLWGTFPVDQFDIHRRRIGFTIDQLALLPETKSPRFVFAPILAPHPPFVFGSNGEEMSPTGKFSYADGNHYMSLEGASPEGYREGYRGQLHYLNSLVIKAIDGILAQPGKEPIIILQADHGPGSRLSWEEPESTCLDERLAILNALYLPEGGDMLVYDEITPVNTFRLVFDRYLGTDFGRIEDRSYFSRWNTPYRFIHVTDDMNGDSPEGDQAVVAGLPVRSLACAFDSPEVSPHSDP